MGFTPADLDQIEIAHICRLVEGFPLAIELAAAWVKLLSCQEIADEIEKNLDFLADLRRDLPERHHSLRAVFEQSWGLLPAPERRVLQALSVFRGEFSRQAAEQIAGASLPLLSALVDKSFLRRNISGRYEMQELLKQYAREKLNLEPERFTAVRQAHTNYFTGLLAGCEKEFKSAGQIQAMRTIEPVIEDIRSAWYWAAEHGDAQAILNAIDSLIHYYSIRGRLHDGLDDFDFAAGAYKPVWRLANCRPAIVPSWLQRLPTHWQAKSCSDSAWSKRNGQCQTCSVSWILPASSIFNSVPQLTCKRVLAAVYWVMTKRSSFTNAVWRILPKWMKTGGP